MSELAAAPPDGPDATNEHASVLFEVMFRKNNNLSGNNRIEG